jgi:hypothetical protein
LIEIPAVPVGTKVSRWRPPNNRGPKEKFLRKVQSFSDTLYKDITIERSMLHVKTKVIILEIQEIGIISQTLRKMPEKRRLIGKA